VTDAAGRKDRPGAGSHCEEMLIEGNPLNCYLNYNPETERVEVVRIMPPGVPDQLLRDFPDEESAWAWTLSEVRVQRLP